MKHEPFSHGRRIEALQACVVTCQPLDRFDKSRIAKLLALPNENAPSQALCPGPSPLRRLVKCESKARAKRGLYVGGLASLFVIVFPIIALVAVLRFTFGLRWVF